MVTARTADDSLYRALLAGGADPAKTHAAGDCVAPGTIQAATFAGHRIGRAINGEPTDISRREAPLLLAEIP
jgi:hypothetical protein